MKLEDAERVAALDECVQAAQELTDVYVKFLEDESMPSGGPEADRAVVNNLLVAFAKFYFANRTAIVTVSESIVGGLDIDMALGDF